MRLYYFLRQSYIGRKIRNGDNRFAALFKKMVQSLWNLTWREKKVSYGDRNSTDIIYIIRRKGTVVGLFSYIFTALARIRDAEKEGWIPVIDMKNYPNAYLDESRLGVDNVWEYYFLQPDGVSLEEAYKSKNVILSSGDLVEDRPKSTKELMENINGELDEWRRIVKKYLILNESTKLYINRAYQQLISKKDRTLGIICRGTDYVKLKPKGHPIQPTEEEIVDKALKVIDDYNINVVFIGTEDIKIFNVLKEKLQDKVRVVSNEKKWVNYTDDFLVKCNDNSVRDNDKYLSGLEYFTTIYILSMCNCIIGGRPGGATAAMILSDGFEYSYFWDKGTY